MSADNSTACILETKPFWDKNNKGVFVFWLSAQVPEFMTYSLWKHPVYMYVCI